MDRQAVRDRLLQDMHWVYTRILEQEPTLRQEKNIDPHWVCSWNGHELNDDTLTIRVEFSDPLVTNPVYDDAGKSTSIIDATLQVTLSDDDWEVLGYTYADEE